MVWMRARAAPRPRRSRASSSSSSRTRRSSRSSRPGSGSGSAMAATRLRRARAFRETPGRAQLGRAFIPGAASPHPGLPPHSRDRLPTPAAAGRYQPPGKCRVPGESPGLTARGLCSAFLGGSGAGSGAASRDGGAGHQRGAAAAPLRPGQPGAVPGQPLARLPSAARGHSGCQAVQVTHWWQWLTQVTHWWQW